MCKPSSPASSTVLIIQWHTPGNLAVRSGRQEVQKFKASLYCVTSLKTVQDTWDPHLWLAGRKRDGRRLKINYTKINWMQEISLSPDRKIWNIYTHTCVHNHVCIWVCMFNRHVLRTDDNIQYQFLQNYFISWFSCWVRKESQINIYIYIYPWIDLCAPTKKKLLRFGSVWSTWDFILFSFFVLFCFVFTQTFFENLAWWFTIHRLNSLTASWNGNQAP